MTLALILEWAPKIALWWTCISVIALPFVLALLRANGPEPRPAPRLIAVDGRRVEQR